MEICERSFDLVEDHLTALDYTGPVGLSCDDTKLFGALRLYWDAEQKAHFLVGGVGGPCRVTDPEQVKQVIEDANIRKATKVWIAVARYLEILTEDVHLADLAMVFDNPSPQDDTNYCRSYSHH